MISQLRNTILSLANFNLVSSVGISNQWRLKCGKVIRLGVAAGMIMLLLGTANMNSSPILLELAIIAFTYICHKSK